MERGVRDRNQIFSLDTILYDMFKIWISINQKNAIGRDSIHEFFHVNSPGTVLSTNITKFQVMDRITSEFTFFDLEYFNKRHLAFINMYLIGKGNLDGTLPCSDGDLSYYQIIDSIVKGAESQISFVRTEGKFTSKKYIWTVNLYIDASYSGSALD